MTDSIDLPGLGENTRQLFEWFCERAVGTGNPTASIGVGDAKAAQRPSGAIAAERPGGPIEEIEPGIIALMNEGYVQRSGWRQYVVTQNGFEIYARSRIGGYEATADAVRDAVSVVDHTDTDAIVASTGESRYLINHVLRTLQRNRDIAAFVAESNSIFVTHVSEAFKRQQTARRSESPTGPVAVRIGSTDSNPPQDD